MAFQGLFVGIDHYASSQISWLSCAKKDAIALHALFTDTFGGNATLLTDENATRQEIEKALQTIASCDDEDVVVVAFSGHGSKTHELITYDTSLNDLNNTAIPLDLLTELFSKIKSRHLLCILDCCFSGGAGAKVLQTDAQPKDLLSTSSILDSLSGDGRLIFTASKADEPAWENNRLGHGLLTYYLLEGLQGVQEVIQEGKISIYRLLDHVTRRVLDKSGKMGKAQHPTMRGKIDGELKWPVFQPGPLYQKAFPNQKNIFITKDIHSLSGYGFPSALLAAWAQSIPSLNNLQVDAINEYGLLKGEHLLVSAPTSSGKTMVGELAALKGILERKRAVFLLPLKALVNDKHQQFTRIYGEYGIRVIRATGEITDDIPALMRGQYDLCLFTYEKFSALVLGSPFLLDQIGTIVIDEVQMIADETRGVNLEFLLTLLRVRRQQGIEPQLIALSAVMGSSNGLERWLGGRILRREERPVPLNEGILKADGSFRYIDSTGNVNEERSYIQRIWNKNSSQDWVIPLVQRLVSEGKQVIVFRETRPETRGCALYLARELGLSPAQEAIDALPLGDPSGASHALREALSGGVAFHNSNLDREERLIIEEHFRAQNSTLRVLVATTTLAMGVNTPAEAVVIVGLEHPGPRPYSIAEYKNLAGRAGRLGYSTKGLSFLLALGANEENFFWTRYVLGKPEEIQSKFFVNTNDLRSIIIRALSAYRKAGGKGLSADEISEFLLGSFGAFQKNIESEKWNIDQASVIKSLVDLEKHQLVENDETNCYRLTRLGRLAGENGVEVESVVRVVSAMKGMNVTEINDQTLIAIVQLTCEMDNLYFPLNKKSKYKEPQTWSEELRRQGVALSVLNSLSRFTDEEHQTTLRAKKAVACLLWMSPLSLVEIERILTQFGGSLDGAAGDIRSVQTRSCDLLQIVIRIADILHPDLDLSKRAPRLLARLETGAGSEVADLAAVLGSNLARSDYQHLLNAGLCTIKAVENASDEVILDCLEEGPRRLLKLASIRKLIVAYHESENIGSGMIPEIPIYEG